MIKGGYEIVDFKDIPIITGGEDVTIVGMYNRVANLGRKLCIISGLNLNGRLYPDFTAVFNFNDENPPFIWYQILLPNFVIEDEVSGTFTALTIYDDDTVRSFYNTLTLPETE